VDQPKIEHKAEVSHPHHHLPSFDRNSSQYVGAELKLSFGKQASMDAKHSTKSLEPKSELSSTINQRGDSDLLQSLIVPTYPKEDMVMIINIHRNCSNRNSLRPCNYHR
jgi:hypothetical protein